MQKRQISDDMTLLLRQLVMQGQLKMALMILEVCFLREWKVAEDVAKFYARRYLMKYFPKQVTKYRQRIAKENSIGGMPNAKRTATA